MFTNMSYVRCQNTSISHVFSNIIKNAGFYGEKKRLLQFFFLTFLFPIETTKHLDVFFFYIPRWNLKTSNIFSLWWATLLSHFLHFSSQPFRWKNMIKEWIFHRLNEWNGWFRYIGRIGLFLDFGQFEWINFASPWTCKNCEAVVLHLLFPAQSKPESP